MTLFQAVIWSFHAQTAHPDSSPSAVDERVGLSVTVLPSSIIICACARTF
jgi:hypothetical protein